jgi:hypothetical protein
MDLNRWKKHQPRVSTLELDPLNPRIPALVDAPSQRDIVAYMVEHEEVYDLARSIADFGGLYPGESLIAVEEDGKKTVVEGNRRLAALKLLNSPDLAPDKMKGKFRSLIHNLPAPGATGSASGSVGHIGRWPGLVNRESFNVRLPPARTTRWNINPPEALAQPVALDRNPFGQCHLPVNRPPIGD